MNILLNGNPSLEALFAGIDIDILRETFREAQDYPGRIPRELKPLIAMPELPEKLVRLARKTAV